MTDNRSKQSADHAVVEMQMETVNNSETSPDSSNLQTWVKFEDETNKQEAATIIPSQSIHVTSSPQPVNDPLRRMEKESSNENAGASHDPAHRAVTPPPPKPPLRATKTSSASPSRSVPTPPNPQRIAHKAPSVPHSFGTGMHTSASNIMKDGVSGELQNIPLQDVSSANPEQQTCNHVRQGFANGDVIVSLLPVNAHCAWITKAEFKPELVPEELMAQGLTLTVEDYVMAMQVLVNDVRFNLYIVCYKRVLMMWILLGFIILLSLLFSGIRGLALFGGGIIWLIVNAVGIFVCMWLKIKLYRLLERCMAHVNAMFYKHKILVGLDDRGKISCHKVHLIFVYFDVSYCIKYLNDMLENDERRAAERSERTTANNALNPIDRSRMDIDMSGVTITGSSPTHLPQKEKYAEKLLTRYSQRWVKEYIRKRLDLNLPLYSDGMTEMGPPIPPRHCPTARCPCQFIEEHLRFKPLSKCSIRELFT